MTEGIPWVLRLLVGFLDERVAVEGFTSMVAALLRGRSPAQELSTAVAPAQRTLDSTSVNRSGKVACSDP